MPRSTMLKACIEACRQCNDMCQDTLFTHCLEVGGEHVAKEHVNLMVDCIQICTMASSFMLRKSENHLQLCQLCASVCEACAKSCEEIGSDVMTRCADMCRNCARHCRMMIQSLKQAA